MINLFCFQVSLNEFYNLLFKQKILFEQAVSCTFSAENNGVNDEIAWFAKAIKNDPCSTKAASKDENVWSANINAEKGKFLK
jgi:hypothetical protein